MNEKKSTLVKPPEQSPPERITYSWEITTEEKAILGYLTDPSKRYEDNRLEEKYFTTETARGIFGAIQELKVEEKPIDAFMLSEKLDVKITIEEVDGWHAGCLDEINFKKYVNLLIGAYFDKEALKQISEAKGPELLPELKKTIEEWTALGTIEDIRNCAIPARIDTIKKFIATKRKAKYLGLEITCFKKLTEALNGLREIIVISAQPKVGKTAFVLQVASDIAEQGYGILYYDFENGAENLIMREICRRQNISFEEIFKGPKKESESYIDHAEAGLNSLKEYKSFFIKTDRNLNIEKIKGDVLQMRRLTDKKEILIIIDSLQKLPMKDLKDRRAAIDRWLRDFEELKANDPYLTIILVCELSREKQQPKESGDIEYTGHFLLRLKKNKEKTNDTDSEPEDDFKRNLFLEYARDVESGKTIAQYEADFEHWKFTEIETKGSKEW